MLLYGIRMPYHEQLLEPTKEEEEEKQQQQQQQQRN